MILDPYYLQLHRFATYIMVLFTIQVFLLLVITIVVVRDHCKTWRVHRDDVCILPRKKHSSINSNHCNRSEPRHRNHNRRSRDCWSNNQVC